MYTEATRAPSFQNAGKTIEQLNGKNIRTWQGETTTVRRCDRCVERLDTNPIYYWQTQQNFTANWNSTRIEIKRNSERKLIAGCNIMLISPLCFQPRAVNTCHLITNEPTNTGMITYLALCPTVWLWDWWRQTNDVSGRIWRTRQLVTWCWLIGTLVAKFAPVKNKKDIYI